MLKVTNLVWASLRGRPSLRALFIAREWRPRRTPIQVFIKISVTDY